jgi:hypothetical protein
MTSDEVARAEAAGAEKRFITDAVNGVSNSRKHGNPRVFIKMCDAVGAFDLTCTGRKRLGSEAVLASPEPS